MTNRKKWIIVALVIMCVLFALVWGIASGIYRLYLSHVEMTDEELDELLNPNTAGYGFPYENGWSSVNLWPYHIENEDNILIQLEEPATFTIDDPNQMPILDGAEAAYPVYSAFALNCYTDYITIHNESVRGTAPVRFTNTIEAYKWLLAGEVDVFFGAQPSQQQKEMAQVMNKELKLTPLAREAFVFFVSKDNPVEDLSAEQIRGIYSGKYTNWKSVGGPSIPILAFQRPNNSGSQTMMQYFMGDTKLKEPLKVEWADGMGTVLEKVANYQNKKSAIGYSFRYYASEMENSYQDDIKFLAVNGIAPTAENIADGTYPLTTTLYAITLADNPKETVQPFLDWVQGEQGQYIVEQTGYVIGKD